MVSLCQMLFAEGRNDIQVGQPSRPWQEVLRQWTPKRSPLPARHAHGMLHDIVSEQWWHQDHQQVTLGKDHNPLEKDGDFVCPRLARTRLIVTN